MKEYGDHKVRYADTQAAQQYIFTQIHLLFVSLWLFFTYCEKHSPLPQLWCEIHHAFCILHSVTTNCSHWLQLGVGSVHSKPAALVFLRLPSGVWSLKPIYEQFRSKFQCSVLCVVHYRSCSLWSSTTRRTISLWRAQTSRAEWWTVAALENVV